jgi:hypothetical protein
MRGLGSVPNEVQGLVLLLSGCCGDGGDPLVICCGDCCERNCCDGKGLAGKGTCCAGGCENAAACSYHRTLNASSKGAHQVALALRTTQLVPKFAIVFVLFVLFFLFFLFVLLF